MSLRLYNTRTRSVEPFVPLDAGHVRIYVCGLTPSAEAHLGHARSFMFFDVLRRYLTHLGLRVTYVQNVTDIDDRSIAAARESGGLWSDVVAGYFGSFKRSMTRLGVIEPDHEPHATHFIPEIVETIAALIERGNAYAVDDGVYFAVRSFPRYGALSGRNIEELMIGARITADENKHDPLDFALWKFAKPGEPSWPSPWGDGRPGWHIECSAMSHALLGEPFDIHGGGYDLIFPHHENEIAQTESLVPPPMANVWMHGGLLLFDGRKMSKSLGNFEPLATLLDRHDAQAIRLLFLQAGYRKPLNFTEDSIAGRHDRRLRRLLQAAYDTLRTAPAASTHDDARIRNLHRRVSQRASSPRSTTISTRRVRSPCSSISRTPPRAAIAVGEGEFRSRAFCTRRSNCWAFRSRAVPPSPATSDCDRCERRVAAATERNSKSSAPPTRTKLLPADTVDRLRSHIPDASLRLNGHSKSAADGIRRRHRSAARGARNVATRFQTRRRDAPMRSKRSASTVTDRKEGASKDVDRRRLRFEPALVA